MDLWYKITAFLNELFFPVALAMLGGIVHLLQTDQDRLSFREFITGILTAAFSAIVVYHIFQGYISPTWMTATCGIAGYSAPEVLRMLRKKMLHELRERVVVKPEKKNESLSDESNDA
jgi:hypothetical protein